MQLSFNFDDTASPEAIASRLRMVAGVFEGKPAKEAASRKNTDAPAEEPVLEAIEDVEPEVAPAKKAKGNKKAKAAPEPEEDQARDDDQDEFDIGDEESEAEEPEENPVTIKEVIAGFKAYAKENGRDKAAGVLKKMKVKSVHELKADQYAKVLALLEA